MCCPAWCEDKKDTETEEIKAAVELQQAKNNLAAARYGSPIETKSGAVEGSDKLLMLLRRYLPRTTEAIGADLADKALKSCTGTIVLVDGDVPMARLAIAQSNFETLKLLEQAIANHGKKQTPGTQTMGVLPVLSFMGSVATVLKLFQADYKVSSVEMAADMDWVAASMLRAGNVEKVRLISERFPSLSNVNVLVKRFAALREGAARTKDKDLIATVDTFIASATKGGMEAPIAAMAQYLPLQDTPSAYCLALIHVSISPLAITRQTAFGGQGKAYLSADVIGTLVLVDAAGRTPMQTCVRRTLQGTVNLKELVKSGDLPSSLKPENPKMENCGQPET